jgi:hypothetical protein
MHARFAIAAALLTLAAFAAGGCARRPFTHQMRSLYQLEPETIRQIQVYTSHDIVLERRVDRKRGEASEDRDLILKETELIRRIYIPEGTPGVIVGVQDDRLEVQFEPGATLIFGSTEKNRNKLDGFYHLMALRWEDGRGVVKYGGELFLTQPGAGKVYLTVRARGAQKTKVVRKTVRGMLATQPAERLLSPPLAPDERMDAKENSAESGGADAAQDGS